MIRRRQFITALTGAACMAASHASAAASNSVLAFVNGATASVEYHWMAGQYDLLPGLIDLLQRRIAVIATPGFPDGAVHREGARHRHSLDAASPAPTR
jgi:hypothetical protein